MAADADELTPTSFMKAQPPPPADLSPDSFMDDERRRQSASPSQLTPEVFMNTVNGTPALLATADQAAAERHAYVDGQGKPLNTSLEAGHQGFFDKLKEMVFGGPHVGDTPLGRATHQESFENTPTTDLPLLRPTAFAPSSPDSIGGGIAKGAAEFAEGMTTAPNVLMAAGSGGLGMLGKVSSLLPRAISGLFSLDMLHSAYQQFPEVKKAWDAGDAPATAQALTKAAATGALGVLAGVHAARGEANVAGPKETPLESAKAGAQALNPPADELTPEKFMEGTPQRRVTGSSNIPLNDQGLAQSADLAQRTAGQFTQINTSPMDRARETAFTVAETNPGAKGAVSDALGPWKLGEHEALPAEQEAPAIEKRITETPDEAPPGRGPASTDDGESFNQAKDRIIGEVQKQAADIQPGESVLNVTHGRQLRIVDAWAKAGFPPDKSIDLDTMTKEGDWAKPGQLMRLTDKGLDPVEDGTQGGIHFVRHGDTDFSMDEPAKPADNISPESKPLWEMSHDELSAEEQSAKDRDKNDLVDLFGADGADRYKRLERVSNSSSRSDRETSAARDEMDKMEGSLSEQQRNRLFGIGDDRPQIDDIREYRQALGRLDWSSPKALGDSLKWAVTGIGDKDNPADMTQGERVRYAQLRSAMSEASRLGWDPEEISHAALKGAAERFPSSEAPFMLRRYLQQDRPAAIPERLEAPRREPATPSLYGREASIAVPGEQTRYPARYAVRELSDVQASHNPSSFQPNPLYEHTNDRDYSRAGNATRVIKNASEGTFDPEFLTTDSPTAEHGTPVIDPNGNALGGNSRTMSLSRVYGRGGDDAARYRAQLVAKAHTFGVDPSELAKFKRPVLVRELTGDVDPQKAITDFNKTAAAELTPEERAVSDGRRMSPRTIAEIGSRLDDLGEDGTLASALRGEDGTDILNSLVKDGVLTEQEKGGYLDDRGALTPEAKSRIGKALVGRLYENPADFRATSPEMRAKLERIAPQILRVEGRDDWALTDKLREAVALAEDARVHKLSAADQARHDSIWKDQKSYSPDAVRMAEVLEKNPVQAAAVFRRYANDEALSRPGSQESMFKPPTQAEAFADAFKPVVRSAGERGSISPELLTLGADKFVREDVIPAVKRVAGDLVEAKDQIEKLVAPTLRSESAMVMGLSLRQRMAQFARRFDQGQERLRTAERFFRDRSADENYKFIDNIEKGKTQGDPDLDAIAGVFGKMLDQRRREVQALGEGALDRFYRNYFPHVFERPEKAEQFVNSFFSGKRNMEGPKSFLKHREFPTFEEALKAGMKPVSDNPVRLVLLKVREMDRYLMAHAVLRDLGDNGFAKRVAVAGEDPRQMKLDGEVVPAKWLVPSKNDLPDNFKSIADPVGGGKWYAEEGAAQVLNNYLTPGLRGKSGLFRIALGMNNTMNQSNLGLSAFHLTAESINSVVSRVALGLLRARHGDLSGAAFRVATSPAAPFIDYFQGSKVLREWYKPGAPGAPIAAITDALMKGGGRAKMDEFYANNMAEKMMTAFRSGNFIGGALRSPFAGLEAVSKPLMTNLVPRLKLGAFSDMAAHEMDKLGPGATVEQTRAAMAGAWDSVENRFGEMTYDNLFWNRTFKDLSMLAVRSVGWNLGTIRELAGAGVDAANILRGRAPENEHRLAYAVALPIVAGLMGAMYQYAHTGKGPQELKDYFFPEREDGKRYAMPTYVKDAYHYAADPLRTIENKTGPLINTVSEMLHNRDYYDRPIRNADDPLVKQLGQEAGFVGRQMLPFTLQQYFGNGKKKPVPETNPEHQVENFLGIQKAPGELQPGYKPRRVPSSR